MDNLATFQFVESKAATNLRGALTDIAQGSRNLIPLGQGQLKPFKGLDPLGTGSRQLFLLRDGYGGLNDVVISMVNKEGSGFVFSDIADSIFYGGQGQLSINGTAISGAIASALLRVILKWNNSYTDAKSGPYLVGLPEPSAPVIGLLDNPPGDVPQMNGNYCFQYARLSALNGRSRASASTPIINVPAGKGVYMVIPLPTTNTAGHVIFVTQKEFAGLGTTLRLSRANVYTKAEFTEDDVQRTLTVAVDGTAVVNTATAQFTQGDVGKRFDPLTGGYSVPSGTTIITINSPTQVTLSNPVTGTTGNISADFISFFNGIDRAVALNWKESEITSEEAWIYDFPPPPCSHAFALGKRIYLVSYPDSLNDASADETGTALIPSIANQLESFDLRYPLYLQERVIDVKTRMMSSYVFLGCRNGIYAVQEIGSDLTPATISTIIQGEGIKSHKNWGFSKNALYIASADGKIIRIVGNGDVDSSFADPISYLIKDALQDDMVIAADPKNQGMVLFINGVALVFDEQTSRWSTELFLNDSAAGNAISALGTISTCIVTMDNAGTHSLYEFDKGNPKDTLTMSPFVAPDGNYQKVINRFNVQFTADRIDKNLYFAIHTNNSQTHVKKAVVTGTAFSATDGDFTDEMRGSFVLIKGAGAGGAWYVARINTVTDATHLVLNQAVPTNVTNAYALIARFITPLRVNRPGTHQLESPEMFINAITSFAVSMLIETSGKEAQLLMCDVNGTVIGEQWFQPSGAFGFPADPSDVNDLYEEIEDLPTAANVSGLPGLFN